MGPEIDYSLPLPLSQPWERAATKEITITLQGLTSGAFPTPHNLRDKLLDLADWLGTEYCGIEAETPESGGGIVERFGAAGFTWNLPQSTYVEGYHP